MIARARCLVLTAVVLASVAACGADEPAPSPGGTAAAPAAPVTDSPSATAAPSPLVERTTPAAPEVRTLEVTVSGGEVTPAPAQVDLAVGETLRLVVTSDRDGELHAHGFEVSEPVPAGTPTAVELTGTAPGVYEVELHDPDLLLLQVAVR